MGITQETRRAAYNEALGKIGPRQAAIYRVLPTAPDGLTAEEVADLLLKNGVIRRFDMNYVRPRLTELKEAGVVETVGKRPSYRTKKQTAVWAKKRVDVRD